MKNNLLMNVIDEIKSVADKTDFDSLEDFAKEFNIEKRYFFYGAGRSELQLKSFAMRLMQLGFEVVVVGETITPAITEDDVLVLLSGSGETSKVLNVLEKSKKVGARNLALSSKKESSLSKKADKTMIIPGATKDGSGPSTIQLLSSLFDQSAHIIMDCLALMIANNHGITNEDAKKTHSNLE